MLHTARKSSTPTPKLSCESTPSVPSRNLSATEATPSRPALTRASDAELPLSFAEESTWNSSRTLEASARYTFAAGKRIDGQLDVPALRRAVDHIVRRHEILRTSFTDGDHRECKRRHPGALR